MAGSTTNYGLTKPTQNEFYNVDVQNGNMDIIDGKLKEHATSLSELTQDRIYYCGATSGTNTYTVTNSEITAYTEGLTVRVKIGTASTGASTLNINGLGAKTILDSLGNAITSGGLKAGLPYQLCYNGTNFIVLGKGGGGNVTPDKMLNGITATGDNGPVVGNIPTKTAQTYTPGTTNQTIAAGQYIAEVQTILGDADLISANIKAGANILNVAGKASVVDTADATALAAQIVSGYTAYKNGAKITGTASIESLGGRRYVEGVINHVNGIVVTITLPFSPRLVKLLPSTEINGNTSFINNGSSFYGLSNLYCYSVYTIVGNVLRIGDVGPANTITYYAWE